jgi:hypothetical protein
VPRHRVLTTFARQLTARFTVTNALDLEYEETPIPVPLFNKIETYGHLSSVWRHFDESKGEYRVSLNVLRLV